VVSLDHPPEGNAVGGTYQRPGSLTFVHSGTVMLTSVTPPVGNIDVTLETGERLTGTFAAKACSAPPGAF
jgi:hypothetical protein